MGAPGDRGLAEWQKNSKQRVGTCGLRGAMKAAGAVTGVTGETGAATIDAVTGASKDHRRSSWKS